MENANTYTKLTESDISIRNVCYTAVFKSQNSKNVSIMTVSTTGDDQNTKMHMFHI